MEYRVEYLCSKLSWDKLENDTIEYINVKDKLQKMEKKPIKH